MNPSEKWDRIGDNPLVMVDELSKTWNQLASDFMQDDDFGQVLDIAIRMIAGDVPDHDKVARVCVKLESYALKYRVQYAMFMGPLKATEDANMKKNLSKELYYGIDNLVSALKYLIK